MPKFRKKPVVIEARQLPDIRGHLSSSDDAREFERVREWCGGDRKDASIVIHTLEGDHLAAPGDYVIQGVQGEFYPCKPDIFRQTYEPAS
jgi:hypothetical protein